jgi:predicted ATPase
LVTLLGPGGVGKTRLAIAAAAAAAGSFPFGGAFVDLVPVAGQFVAQAVAAVLGVAESPQRSLTDAITERLGRGPSLLVLDNCEHLLDSVTEFADLVLAACPGARVLVTSRERLRVPGERTIPVRPLPSADAEALFHDRAMTADPNYAGDPDAVADVCARLDGLPLTIELAAARWASLGAAGLLAGLGDHLRLLSGGRGADARHRSLRAVLEWSHGLLDSDEQRLLRSLSVFAGLFDLAGIAAVSGDEPAAVADLLGRLVDKSLVVVEPLAGRWRLLATVRAFARDRLRADGAGEDLRARHLAWAAATAATLDVQDFDLIADDLRAALWSCPPGQDRAAHTLARGLGRLTYLRRFLREARESYLQAAERAPTPGEAAQDLRSAAECAQVAHDSGGAYDLLLSAAEYARTAGHDTLRAITTCRAVEMACRYPATFTTDIPYEHLCRLLETAAATADPTDRHVAARLAIAASWTAGPRKLTPDLSLAKTAVIAAADAADPVLGSAALQAVRTALLAAGRGRDAYLVTTERLALIPQLDPGVLGAASEIEDILAVACYDAVAVGDLPAALGIARQILDQDRDGDLPFLSLSKAIPPLVLTGRFDEALRHAEPMWRGWVRAGRMPAVWLPTAAHLIALAHGLTGHDDGVSLWRTRAEQAATFSNVFHERHAPVADFIAARTLTHRGCVAGAAELVERAFGYPPEARYRAYAVATAAELAVVAQLPDAAQRVRDALPVTADNAWATACLLRAEARLDPDKISAAAQAWVRIDARFEHARTLALHPDSRSACHHSSTFMGTLAAARGDAAACGADAPVKA